MNPNSNETASGIQLPAPAEQAPTGAPTEAAPQGAEQAPVMGERAVNPTAGAPAAMPATIPLPYTPIPPSGASNGVLSTTNSSTSITADDGDLIEKEWVEKAKAIVDRTRDDPHKQSEEITVFRADYMKKRYNKTIKLK